jgi:hypothetical protein
MKRQPTHPTTGDSRDDPGKRSAGMTEEFASTSVGETNINIRVANMLHFITRKRNYSPPQPATAPPKYVYPEVGRMLDAVGWHAQDGLTAPVRERVEWVDGCMHADDIFMKDA